MANQLQTTCDNLRSFVAAGSVGRGRRPAPPAFVGCISGLGGNRGLGNDLDLDRRAIGKVPDLLGKGRQRTTTVKCIDRAKTPGLLTRIDDERWKDRH